MNFFGGRGCRRRGAGEGFGMNVSTLVTLRGENEEPRQFLLPIVLRLFSIGRNWPASL